VKGHVPTFRSYGDKTLTIARIEPPAIFGEMGCFLPGKYYFSAEALHDSRVRLISRDRIEGLLECAPGAAHKFIDLMGERCRHVLRKMETSARKGLIPRVATLLLEEAEDGVVVDLDPRASSRTARPASRIHNRHIGPIAKGRHDQNRTQENIHSSARPTAARSVRAERPFRALTFVTNNTLSL